MKSAEAKGFTMNENIFTMDDTLIVHSGVKGMHWGVRRYQNYDGSLTSAGRKRYGEKGFLFSKTPSQKVAAAKAKSANKQANTSSDETPSVQSIIRKASVKDVKKISSSLSDKDLQDYIKRKQLENQLDALVKNESAGTKALNKVRDIGSAIGTVYNAVNNARNMVQLVKAVKSDVSALQGGSSSSKSSNGNSKEDNPLYATLDDVTAAMNTAKSESKKYTDDIIKDSKDSYADSVFKKVDEQFSKKSEELDKKFMNEKTDWMKKVDMEALSDQMARQNDKDEVKRWVHNNYLKKPFQDDGL